MKSSVEIEKNYKDKYEAACEASEKLYALKRATNLIDDDDISDCISLLQCMLRDCRNFYRREAKL